MDVHCRALIWRDWPCIFDVYPFSQTMDVNANIVCCIILPQLSNILTSLRTINYFAFRWKQIFGIFKFFQGAKMILNVIYIAVLAVLLMLFIGKLVSVACVSACSISHRIHLWLVDVNIVDVFSGY